jgi:hypothetical protein
MNTENKLSLEKFFGKNMRKFDVAICQMAFHYFLKNDETWNNIKSNLNMCIKDGGYFMITCFDAKQVLNFLNKQSSHVEFYTDEKGVKHKLFEIISKFDQEKILKDEYIGLGIAIDLFGAWMFEEGTYQEEYLVDINFIKEELLRDCNLELVETDLFQNQFTMHKEQILNYSKYMANPKTRQFLFDAATYYEETDINKSCYKYTNLHRYSIFRKKEASKINSMKGGFQVSRLNSKYNDKYSFLNSIHHILKSTDAIPQTLSPIDLFSDLQITMIEDSKLTKKDIMSIGKKVKIYNKIGNIENTVCDGLIINYFENNAIIKNNTRNKISKQIILSLKDNLYEPVFFLDESDKKIGLFEYDDKIFLHSS